MIMKVMKETLYWDISMEKERKHIQILLSMKEIGKKIKEKVKEDILYKSKGRKQLLMKDNF